MAIVFIHGFGGDADKTWGQFPSLLCSEQRLQSWDIYSIGYPSNLRIDVPNLWSADPELKILSIELRTFLALPPFLNYKAIAIAAHSMGGLVVQRAILDDQKLMNRISHAIFFGTPSNGLSKAGLFGRLKRQVRDMDEDSTFVTDLRDDWNRIFPSTYHFEMRVIAGDRDEFVPSSSSLAPFPDSVQSVVPGNHLEIVKPTRADEKSVVLVVEALAGGYYAPGVIDGARLAVERRNFQEAANALLPRAEALDNAALVDLALALDGLGRGSEALAILEQRYQGGMSCADALGTLGGRLKRRWLVGRIEGDLLRSRELYASGLDLSLMQKDYEQAYYHAINIAFLDLIASPPNSKIPPQVQEMARRAQDYCALSPRNSWQIATEGEAELIHGDLKRATVFYIQAISMAESPRAIYSMYSQAIRVASRTHGKSGAQRIEEIFGIDK
ncbi:alpha/beta hydrolase [Polynucleobacter paneuropaeus]|nr:alpha/beta hydrolase [Polynucleobacter paneuropaeus]